MKARLALLLVLASLLPLAWSQQPVSLALQPTVLQSHAAASSGSVASLTNAFSSNNLKGDSIIVVFANGNNNNPTAPISDTNSNTYFKATQTANSVVEVEIWYATNIASGANTVTVTPGGSNASIASEVYEVSGLLALSPQVFDQANVNIGTGTALSTLGITPVAPNEFAFAAFGVGTAAQTITVASPYTNDSGQQNPTTPTGLFSFVSASSYLANTNSTTATATITSEPWAAAIASFRPIAVPIQGAVVANQPTGSNLETTLVTTATTTDTAFRCVLVSAASTNSTNCKNGAGNVYGYRFVNTTATIYYLRMYNSNSAPTCSSNAGFVESIPIPASTSGAGIVAIEPMGEGYSTGISFCFTGGSSSTDNTNAATGVFGTILFK